ncbi:MAG: class I SAM-dependent methyltransferase, partial [Acidimicrobiaceae bacterium]|nr:class I SAM-dependent methyltransferase [Acidimicrobiaceae bacterium]
MSDTYQHFANDYDWLFDDEGMRHGVAIQSPATARVLSELTPGSTVLDAACGTGIDAVALERRGFRVHASDGSPAMVEQAVARFRQEGAEVHGFVATWDQLPDSTRRRFDAVLCIGNSLVHATGPEAMVSALRGLRAVARSGGRVVIDSRNWEKLHRDRQIVSVYDRPIARGGRRCVVVY